MTGLTAHPSGHQIREITAPKGVSRGGTIKCECGWTRRFVAIANGLNAHELHVSSVRAIGKVMVH